MPLKAVITWSEWCGDMNKRNWRDYPRVQVLLAELSGVSSDPIPCFLLGVFNIHDHTHGPEYGFISEACQEEYERYANKHFKPDPQAWKQVDHGRIRSIRGLDTVDVFTFGTGATEKVVSAVHREGLSLIGLFNPFKGDTNLAVGVRTSRLELPAGPVPEVETTESIDADDEESDFEGEQLLPPSDSFQIDRMRVLGKPKRRRRRLRVDFESTADPEYPNERMRWAFEVQVPDLVKAVTEMLEGEGEQRPEKAIGNRDNNQTKTPGQLLLKSALLNHHRYGGAKFRAKPPAKPTDLATEVNVSRATVSRFFKKFSGYASYVRLCENQSELENRLALISGDITPEKISQLREELVAADREKETELDD